MKEYMERYNLNIKKWGSSGWLYLMAIALQYPDNPTQDDRENYKTFFLANQHVIPCGLCRKHYSDNLEIFTLTEEVLHSRRTLAQWINKMRNAVNKSNKKPEVDFLHMIADYMTPDMAQNMLSMEELKQLRIIDECKNEAYLQGFKKDRNWWPYVISVFAVFAIVIVLLFVYLIIKSVHT